MSEERSDKSKFLFFTVSVLAHAALIYYVAYKALDYSLPKGEVSSYEVTMTDAAKSAAPTPVAVQETVKPAPVPPAPKPIPPVIKPVAKPKAVAVPPKGTLPVKDASEEAKPQEDLKQAQDDSLQQQDEAAKEEATPEPVPPAPAPEPAPQETAQAPEPTPAPPAEATGSGAGGNPPAGSPEGVQSDTVLTPQPGNKPISYPMMARLRKIEGETVVHYSVNGEGAVTDAQIVQSSGSDVLDNQVVSTVKGWKFKPTGHEGTYERPVKFSLKGESQEALGRLRRGN